jgi:hypothetical protein
VQEEGSLPGMQWRAPEAVCTSAARKIRVPLARARGRASQKGLVSLLGAERMRSHFVVAVAVGSALRAGTRLLQNSLRLGALFPPTPNHQFRQATYRN